MSQHVLPADNVEEPVAVTNFRKYLQIPSVHPNVNYDACVRFLSQLGEDVGLPVKIIYVETDNPVVILTLEGIDPSLKSILLNSHMDVVSVHSEKWTYPPFGAVKDANGNIYGRGAQDTKCTGIQHVEAVRRFVKEGLKLKRTVHVCLVPDEETGGIAGMEKFVQTKEFKELNIGFVMDEGAPRPDEYFSVDWAQRSSWKFDIHCYGIAGHGSMLEDGIAATKLHYILGKSLQYRDKQRRLLTATPPVPLGKLNSINLTIISGGLLENVIPDKLTATFDVRVGIETDHDELESMLLKWCTDAGPGVELEFKKKDPKFGVTTLDSNNPWWIAFKSECDKMELKIITQICPATSDSKFLRMIGIPCLGFSPMNHTPCLLHNHDEYLNETTFLKGIDIYYNIVKGLASV